MPITAALDPTALVLVIVASGDFGATEIEAIQAVTQEHSHDPELKGVLVDVRGATASPALSKPIRAAADRAQDFEATQGLKMAVVAGDDLTFGFSRMYELSRNEDGGVGVFREMEPALEWLGAGQGPDVEDDPA